MSDQSRRFLWFAVALSIVSPAAACTWDLDTVKMERLRFPDALELITGKFLRHSTEFYRWRIEDRLKKLKSAPIRLDYYDDLAVAYNKVGQHDKAIATILVKEVRSPGRYETFANLGAFYIYTGELEKSRDAIAQAIAINPDAHFGREVYQKHLVEYVLSKTRQGKVVLPLLEAGQIKPFEQATFGFADYLASRRPPEEWNAEHAAAIKGVLGMMRFADHDHPVLLEALGDLLSANHADQDSTQLAGRAYLMASYSVPDPLAKQAYRDRVKLAIGLLPGATDAYIGLDEFESHFQTELAEARAWYAQVQQNEAAWIAAGKDPEAEFAAKYYVEPMIAEGPTQERMADRVHSDVQSLVLTLYIAFFGICSVVLTIAVLLIRRWRRQRWIHTSYGWRRIR